MVAPQLHNVDIEDMAPNSGATVQKGLRKVAVYKDEEGKKHAFSALCPHLGCLLQVSFWGFPLKILPFAFWAAFYNSVVMPLVMTSCALALFRVSFAQLASVCWSVGHAWAQFDTSWAALHCCGHMPWLVSLASQAQGLVKLQGLVKPHRQALPAGSLLPQARRHSSQFTDLH